jgi:hypothetical protein
MVSTDPLVTPRWSAAFPIPPNAQASVRMWGSLGGRRFRAWEAVRFGDSRVEKALPSHVRCACMLAVGGVRSVSAYAFSGLDWLITPPRPLPERSGNPKGRGMVTAGEAGTKPAHHSRIEMPSRAICRLCKVLYITLVTSVAGKWYVRLSQVPSA